MRVPWKRLTWILAAALPVAAVAGIIWVGTRDLSRFQSRMTEQVRKVTGRELAARVPLTIKLGTQPAMVAEGVTLTNASWGSRPDLARVRKLTLFLDPASLFLGEVKIGRVLLEGADILVERNEVGDTNLDMLPPPDGSGPHPGENRSLQAAHIARLPVDRHDRGAATRSLTDRRRAGPSAGGAGDRRRRPSSRKRPTSRCSSRASSRRRRPRRSSSPARPARSTAGCGACPATSIVQGGFGGGKIAIKGSVDAKGTNLADHVGRPGRLGVRPLYTPAGAGRRPVCAQCQGRHLAQHLQGRAHVAEGRLQRTRRRGGVPRRPQGHADHHRQCRREPPRSRRPEGRTLDARRPQTRRRGRCDWCRPCRSRRPGSAVRPCR